MPTTKQLMRRYTRRLNVEIRRFDRDCSIDTFLWALFSDLEINCVIDVGAHQGEFAQLLRENDYNGEIHSFEPVRSSYLQLTDKANKDVNWYTYNIGLGEQAETLPLNVGHLTNYSSFYRPTQYGLDTNGAGIKPMSVVDVEVKRLDTVFDEITQRLARPRVYLKMDTQGWDRAVLQGATDCLSAIVALQSELSIQPLYEEMPQWEGMVQMCRELGYEVAGMFMGFRDENYRLSEFDCVFVRQI